MLLKPFFLITILVTILTFTANLGAQTKAYEAFMKGHKIGEMTVTREVNDESEKIWVKSHIEAHMIVKVVVDYESHSTYMNGKLMESEAVSKTNGHEHSVTHTIWKSDHYERNIGRKSKRLTSQNLYGGDLFYFEEPKNLNTVYALSSGEVLSVIQEKPGDYYFEDGGKKELHKYVNGQLVEIHLEHKLYTVIFKLKEH